MHQYPKKKERQSNHVAFEMPSWAGQQPSQPFHPEIRHPFWGALFSSGIPTKQRPRRNNYPFVQTAFRLPGPQLLARHAHSGNDNIRTGFIDGRNHFFVLQPLDIEKPMMPPDDFQAGIFVLHGRGELSNHLIRVAEEINTIILLYAQGK